MSLDVNLFSEDVRKSLVAYGEDVAGVRRAHPGFAVPLGTAPLRRLTREQREDAQNALLAPGATLNAGAGNRAREEEPDQIRTCFERDLDRLRHSRALRSLAGKQQVFLDADGGLRTRLTHSQEVAQIAEGVAQAVGANSVLANVAGLAHDCGHGPAGHDSERAFAQFLPGGFDHAPYGADVVLAPLNLTVEVLDAVRQHSWKLTPPSTPEGELVSWADRIAYVVSDFQDAVRAGIVTPEQLPEAVLVRVGSRPSAQIRAFISALIEGTLTTGTIGMDGDTAEALDAFRKFNYENIYLRPAAQRQADRSIRLLTELVEVFADRPGQLPAVMSGETPMVLSGSAEAAELAVHHVAQMTDRTVLELGVTLLGWDRAALPRGA
jgi:dGTPase